ncbi:MAG: hypothetical protein A3D92_18785 [Bacteroidetes bacterium RIFCSPHIGHO2_02_FULL_44_7]|nr:MAG: hypothetical protein A3D92_18785 [Bacteroidetes bacterium RIFCSPHIGHO2_02_FULL_44_7]
MKKLGIIGFVFGLLAMILGLYLQLSLVPAAAAADANWQMAISMTNDAYFGSLMHQTDMAVMDAKTDFAVIVMFAGILAVLLSIIPAIRKIRIAWIGIILGVAMCFLGAAYGTHMFS